MLLLKSVDYGRMAEILVQRAASPDEFTRLTAITWVSRIALYVAIERGTFSEKRKRILITDSSPCQYISPYYDILYLLFID